MNDDQDEIIWRQEDMVEVLLKEPDDFLKIKETLTRIGIASKKEKKLYQSAHILHKAGSYYILMFKELFKLDKKPTKITEEDILRRNYIIFLLQQWGLLTVVDPKKIENRTTPDSVKIIPHKEKSEWDLVAKYTLGNKNVKKDKV